MPLVVLRGRRAARAPTRSRSHPTTMQRLHLSLGDRVRVGGAAGTTVRVVGEVLLPATSHTDYDQSGWMTDAGPRSASVGPRGRRQREDYLLVRWRAGRGRRRGDAAARPPRR